MNYDIPSWVLPHVPTTGEPTRLSDDDYQKLLAYLPKKPQRVLIFPNTPQRDLIERSNEVRSKLWTLIEYNRLVREQEAASRQNALQAKLPTTVEEALALGYVDCKVIHALFPDRFGNPSKLTQNLDDPGRQDRIRQFKPSQNRRLVCAADLLNVLFSEHELLEAARSHAEGGSPPRRNKHLK